MTSNFAPRNFWKQTVARAGFWDADLSGRVGQR
jgi:hypothetical protein